RLMAVLIALTAVGMVLIVVTPLYQASQNPKPYIAALEKDVQQRIVPMARQELLALRDEVFPAVQAQLTEAQTKRLPDLTRLIETQFHLLVYNIQDETEKKVTVRTQLMA